MSSNEPLEIQSQDTEYLSVIKEELDELEINFKEALSILNLLIELQSINPDENEESKQKFINIIRNLQSKNNGKLQLSSAKLFQLDKKVHSLYRDIIKELNDSNYDSFNKVSEIFESLFDRDLKVKEVQQLEKSLNDTLPIELESPEILNLELSKEEMDEIINIEKNKRIELIFLNENVYEPEIKSLKADYEIWKSRDNELKKFLINDLEEMDKKIQDIKKTECL